MASIRDHRDSPQPQAVGINRQAIREEAHRQGRLAVGERVFLQATAALVGLTKVHDGSQTIAAWVTKQAPKSSVTLCRRSFRRFGKHIPWDRADKKLAVIAFINLADRWCHDQRCYGDGHYHFCRGHGACAGLGRVPETSAIVICWRVLDCGYLRRESG